MLDPAEGTALLLEACATGDADTVSNILNSLNPLVNIDTIRNQNLQTPLHLVCKRKENYANATEIATLLIDHGCDVNNAICDNDGMLPLHYAVLSGNVDCVILLLLRGATIPISDPFRLTPLLLAKAEIEKNERRRSIQALQVSRISNDTDPSLKNLRRITSLLLEHIRERHDEQLGNDMTAPPTSNYGLSNSLLSKSVPLANGLESDLDMSLIVERMRSMSVDADESIDLLISKMQAFGVKPT
ncbi:ankyrin repeat-containing domain protein [Umbelopsis sp. PMI_123]|nr:ankyrin repeat-containing domain protein [Umbelopsis sp. PMI_123]